MSSTNISVDLRNISNLVVEDSAAEEINSVYSPKPNPPKVGWTINTVTTVEGIRSESMYAKAASPTPWPMTDIPDPAFADVFTVLDEHQNFCYGFSTLSRISGGGFAGSRTYKFDIAYDTDTGVPYEVAEFVSASNTNLLMKKWTTLFRNNTLHVKPEGMVIHQSAVNEIDNMTGVFSMDLDLANPMSLIGYPLTGITPDPLVHVGIVSFGNYLMFYTPDTIFWSDPVNFQEFTVGGSSLAGSQKIAEAKGGIELIVAHPQGLMIYCTLNIVFAQYSGDATNPWIYSEVANSTGVIVKDRRALVSSEEVAQTQYAITGKGLMAISPQGAQYVSPKLSAFTTNDLQELKFVNNSSIRIESLLLPDNTSKITYLDSFDDYLIIGTGHEALRNSQSFVVYPTEEFKTYIIELPTGRTTILEVNAWSVSRTLKVRGDFFHEVGHVIPNNFNIWVANTLQPSGDIDRDAYGTTLDLTGRVRPTSSDYYGEYLLNDRREAEVVIEEISIAPNRLTELLGVTLYGDTRMELADASITEDRARVFAYSSLNGIAPIEFIYYPSVGRYLGFIVGTDIKLEIRGKWFYLVNIDIEVQDGGRV